MVDAIQMEDVPEGLLALLTRIRSRTAARALARGTGSPRAPTADLRARAAVRALACITLAMFCCIVLTAAAMDASPTCGRAVCTAEARKPLQEHEAAEAGPSEGRGDGVICGNVPHV